MRRRSRLRQRRNKSARKFKVLLVLTILVTLVVIADGRLRPLIKGMAARQAEIISTRAINEAVTTELTNQNLTYDDLVHVSKDGEGNVKSVEIDITKANHLKAAITTAVQDRMSDFETREISIPLGNLVGGDFFIGRGPRIPIYLTLSGSIYSEVESEFSTAGINQTRHRVMMNIKTNIYVMVPGYNTGTEVASNFIIAETVIVGDVPESFTDLGGIVGKVLDSEDKSETEQ